MIKKILKTDIDFVKYHKLFISISIFLILLSIISLSTKGLNLGIDFSGGILIEAKLKEEQNISKIRNLLDNKINKVNIQNFDKENIMIRIPNSDNPERDINNVKDILSKNFPEIEYRKVDFVGPQIGSELIKKAFLAITLCFLAIMIYIWFRFDWQFGVGAIISAIHDVILTFGFFSLIGIEFNLTSIAALLTIIGYSINDSVVIYDRIRENLIKFRKVQLEKIINSSLNSTLSRTILTSGLTLLSILALIFFGGEVLRSFSLAIFFGITIGTLSSIYISAPTLIYTKAKTNSNSNL